MTLIEFFQRLEETINGMEEDNGPVEMTSRSLIRQRLPLLIQSAACGKEFETYHFETRRLMWKTIIERTRGTPFFDEFKGNESLRRDLKAFLGIAL